MTTNRGIDHLNVEAAKDATNVDRLLPSLAVTPTEVSAGVQRAVDEKRSRPSRPLRSNFPDFSGWICWQLSGATSLTAT